MNAPEPVPFTAQWPEADRRFLAPELPEPPALPLADVLTSRAADWVQATAEGAGAPADYVLAALFAAVGATMGNARWVSPWQGWAEPPILWAMAVGNPSAGKSPAIDAVLAPLRRAEKPLREAAEAERKAWAERNAVAEVAKAAWQKTAAKAVEKGEPAPPMPDEADAGCEPVAPRLVAIDATVEKLGVLAEARPKGVLQFRDELAGWLLTMETRNGGADRPFWLEAYGGRAYASDRMSRASVTIDRLSLGVLGGIQPDRLSALLLKTADDGLLARFLPVWPGRIPPRQPERFASDALADEAFARLVALEMVTDEDGDARPWFVQFDRDAQLLMNDWRRECANWEDGASGLLLSFVGKLPGMAARLALILGAIGHAFDGAEDPAKGYITPGEFGRACHFLEAYALPMARRCYGAASVPEGEMAARSLVALIRETGWHSFKARDVRRKGRAGLAGAKAVNAALAALAEADLIRDVPQPASRSGGRPTHLYSVNPIIHGGGE